MTSLPLYLANGHVYRLGNLLNHKSLTGVGGHLCRRSSCSEGSKRGRNFTVPGLGLHISCCKNSWKYSSRPPPKYPSSVLRPSITPLSQRCLELLLPISGTGSQILQQLGGPSVWLRRLSISLLGSLVTYNINTLLTVILALYWAWAPIFAAAQQNVVLRTQFQHAGMWHARVLAVAILPPGGGGEDADSSGGRGSGPLLQLRVGDASGASVVVTAPLQLLQQQGVGTLSTGLLPLTVGEPAELLVLSDQPTLTRFRALREVYLCNRQLWLCECPFVERGIFEGISSQLEAARAEEGDGGDAEMKYRMVADDVDALSERYDTQQYRGLQTPVRPGTVGGGGAAGSLDYFDDMRELHSGNVWMQEAHEHHLSDILRDMR